MYYFIFYLYYMKKFLILILLLPLFAMGQRPTDDSTKLVAPPIVGSFTMSSLYYRGGNTSNGQVGYLNTITNKWAQLITGYQFNHYTGTSTQTAINAKADSVRLYGTVLPTYKLKSDTVNAQGYARNWQLTNALSNYYTKTASDAKYEILSNKGISNGYASLDGSGKVPLSQINDALLGAVNYQGSYNATTNSPALPTAASGNKGYYWVVSVAGTQFGLTLNAGDWIISNGSAYQKVDNNNAVTSVFGLVGVVPNLSGDISSSGTTTTVNTINSITKSYYDPTSSIQTQLNGKAKLVGGNSFTGDQTMADNIILPNNSQKGILGGDDFLISDSTISNTAKIRGYATPNKAFWLMGATNNTLIGYNGIRYVIAGISGSTPLAGNPILTNNSVDTVSNKRIDVSANTLLNVPNSSLINSSITVNGTNIALGASGTITSNIPNSLTFNNSGSGASSGVTFNGGAAQTISYNTIGALSSVGTAVNSTLWNNQTFAGTFSGGGIDGFIVRNASSGAYQYTTNTTALSTLISLGAGVQTALGVNIGSTGAPVLNGGVLGVPSSGTVTNLTGTASISINGTVGATTANTGAFTTINASGGYTQTGTATNKLTGDLSINTNQQIFYGNYTTMVGMGQYFNGTNLYLYNGTGGASALILSLTGNATFGGNLSAAGITVNGATLTGSNKLAVTGGIAASGTIVAQGDLAASGDAFVHGVASLSYITAGSTITAGAYTVATLPVSPGTGATAYVIDALAPGFLTIVVGGGTVKTPVFYNGTNWVAY